MKITWLISIVTVSLSMMWFLFASTACFQRKIGLVTIVIFLIAWIPALCFVVLSFLALKSGWMPSNIFANIILTVGVIVISYVFVATFLNNSSVYGWLKESVTKDYIQTTVDEKYEYRIEIVNIFQKNSYVRLYVKDVSDGKETKLYLDIPIREIYAISGGEGSIYPEPETPPVWSNLMSTDKESIYILTTTKVFDSENEYSFIIDVTKDKVTVLSS